MSVNESMKVSGRLTIVHKDGEGNIKDKREIKNLVVASGIQYMINRITSNTDTVMSHLALGSGTTAAAAGDTDVESLLGSFKAFTSATAGADSVAYVADFGPGESTGAITEAGIFNDSSNAGTMLCRTVFPVINKQATDTIQITWVVTLAAT